MSKKDYTSYSKYKEVVNKNTVVNDFEFIEEQAELENKNEKVGVVIDCVKLNIRKGSNVDAEIIGTISVDSEVIIDENESTEDFYKVCTASGVEGFCMKNYVSVR